MKIIDLQEQHLELYFMCLEDWSKEIKEAGNHKACWYAKAKDKGLRVKLAEDDDGQLGGLIQYLPIEHSAAAGVGLYFINCIWVHGYTEGRGNFQHRGMGKALLQAAEDDTRALGAKGMAAWGLWLPFWMKAAWFKKHGYKKADRQGLQMLLYKPFAEGVNPPAWIREQKRPAAVPGQVTVTGFINGWCPAQNLVFERAKRAAQELGEKVVFEEINTFDRATFLEWGIADGLFIDGQPVRNGPPLSYEKIRGLIAKRLKKLK